MGKRYTEQEKHRIQELANQGHTDESIAQQLGRSTNAIRNMRHRNNLKTNETQTIQQLKKEKQELIQQTQEQKRQLRLLERKSNLLRRSIQTEEEIFKAKLETELLRLKHTKPHLFEISGQEQLGKITAQLATSIISWLLE